MEVAAPFWYTCSTVARPFCLHPADDAVVEGGWKHFRPHFRPWFAPGFVVFTPMECPDHNRDFCTCLKASMKSARKRKAERKRKKKERNTFATPMQ